MTAQWILDQLESSNKMYMELPLWIREPKLLEGTKGMNESTNQTIKANCTDFALQKFEDDLYKIIASKSRLESAVKKLEYQEQKIIKLIADRKIANATN